MNIGDLLIRSAYLDREITWENFFLANTKPTIIIIANGTSGRLKIHTVIMRMRLEIRPLIRSSKQAGRVLSKTPTSLENLLIIFPILVEAKNDIGALVTESSILEWSYSEAW